jgi:hypothetical protein
MIFNAEESFNLRLGFGWKKVIWHFKVWVCNLQQHGEESAL